MHRFNSAQQDALLPWVENGTVTLIGATTENPFFEVNKALGDADLRARLGTQGVEFVGGTPEQYGELIRREIVKWARVVKASGARVD